MSEVDLLRPVTAWLEELGYRVYPEHAIEEGGPRIDVAGIKGRSAIAVEGKRRLGPHVVAQAIRHLGSVQRVYVAVPFQPHATLLDWDPILSALGVGLLCVDVEGDNRVEERLCAPPRRPSALGDVRGSLSGKPGTRPAGSPGAPKTNPLRLKLERIARNAPAGGANVADHFEDCEVNGAMHAAKTWKGDWERRGNTRTNLRLFPKGHFDA